MRERELHRKVSITTKAKYFTRLLPVQNEVNVLKWKEKICIMLICTYSSLRGCVGSASGPLNHFARTGKCVGPYHLLLSPSPHHLQEMITIRTKPSIRQRAATFPVARVHSQNKCKAESCIRSSKRLQGNIWGAIQ